MSKFIVCTNFTTFYIKCPRSIAVYEYNAWIGLPDKGLAPFNGQLCFSGLSDLLWLHTCIILDIMLDDFSTIIIGQLDRRPCLLTA